MASESVHQKVISMIFWMATADTNDLAIAFCHKMAKMHSLYIK